MNQNIIDILSGEQNNMPLELLNQKGQWIKFDMVAAIAHEEKLYFILAPLTHFEGIADDEAIVYYIDEDEDGETVFCMETDEAKATEVFDRYYELLADGED